MSRFVWFTLLAGCGASELLPLVDADGALAGTYDPAAAALAVDSDAAAAELSTGERVDLDAGAADGVRELSPGDEVALLDADGRTVEVLVVSEPDASFDAESRYANCSAGGIDDGS
ncbi:MAG: hypothetical protein ABMA64_14205 [Myxococcota bacterium]